ncbi:MAG: DUF1800 domain-containing protein [Nonlabens sp.]|nr:DUF1800 domain-containing protein [Nonlabens sp.]
MNLANLWSLRLGFSTAQSAYINEHGLEQYLVDSFNHEADVSLPSILKELPTDYQAINARRKEINNLPGEEKTLKRRADRELNKELMFWWIAKMRSTPFPLRENMVCFWHNHFVASQDKVQYPVWLFEHHIILHEHATGNLKTLTKAIVKSNAVIHYLDNQKNKKNAINENLGRELLELFTLGIGNYSEADVKNAAFALAGLGYGTAYGSYRKSQRYTEQITFLGKKGSFDIDDIIDIIFEHPNAPYLVTSKIIQWFIQDSPTDSDVKKYGDYLREQNYELQPLLTKLFLDFSKRDVVGAKIKNPLQFALQTINSLQLQETVSDEAIYKFIRDQSMELYKQPNVKGWEGGNAWLTTAIYMQRNQVADMLCNGKMQYNGKNNTGMKKQLHLEIPKELTTNKEVINHLTETNLTLVNDEIQKDLEAILKHDFKPHEPGSELGILRAFQYIITIPEYQVL